MGQELPYIVVSVTIVSLLALVGILTIPLDEDRLQTVVTYLVSFSAGTLFGDAFLHLLPEIVDAYGFDAVMGGYLLSGIVLAFVVEKYVYWHHRHHPHEDRPHPLSYVILFGDGVHNLLDGVIIATSYLASIPLGIATTTAIAFHEVPQEIGDFGVLIYGGVPYPRAIAYNFLTALAAFLGASFVIALAEFSGELIRVFLPVAAGNFIYIAGSDLLPELVAETNERRSTIQMVTFLGGIGLMFLLTL